MKVTVVPAQVTTVEDRIAGSLGVSQLLLLAAPVFGGSTLYIVLPPTMHNATYKLVVIATLMFTCGLLAIRIKGKIVLLWLVTLLRYYLRPRYYVFNKNSQAMREQYEHVRAPEITEKTTKHKVVPGRAKTRLSMADVINAEAIMTNPNAHLAFETDRKGDLRVLITEIKEQV